MCLGRSPDRLLLVRAWSRQPCPVRRGPTAACCMLQTLAARHLRCVLRSWRHAAVTQAGRLHLLSTTLAEQHDLGVLERALHMWQHVRTGTNILLHQNLVLPKCSVDICALLLPASVAAAAGSNCLQMSGAGCGLPPSPSYSVSGSLLQSRCWKVMHGNSAHL